MKKALAAALLIALVCTSTAEASGKKEDKPAENQQYVAVSPVALPVIVKGVVINYIFVTMRVELTPSANSAKAREKEPFFRDAVIRAAHRSPFLKPGDYTHVDEAKLTASLLRDAQVITGPGVVKSVTIVNQQPKAWKVFPPA